MIVSALLEQIPKNKAARSATPKLTTPVPKQTQLAAFFTPSPRTDSNAASENSVPTTKPVQKCLVFGTVANSPAANVGKSVPVPNPVESINTGIISTFIRLFYIGNLH